MERNLECVGQLPFNFQNHTMREIVFPSKRDKRWHKLDDLELGPGCHRFCDNHLGIYKNIDVDIVILKVR